MVFIVVCEEFVNFFCLCGGDGHGFLELGGGEGFEEGGYFVGLWLEDGLLNAGIFRGLRIAGGFGGVEEDCCHYIKYTSSGCFEISNRVLKYCF